MFFLVRTNMLDHFGTPKNNKHILIYNTLQGCPEKVRKTGGAGAGYGVQVRVLFWAQLKTQIVEIHSLRFCFNF